MFGFVGLCLQFTQVFEATGCGCENVIILNCRWLYQTCCLVLSQDISVCPNEFPTRFLGRRSRGGGGGGVKCTIA